MLCMARRGPHASSLTCAALTRSRARPARKRLLSLPNRTHNALRCLGVVPQAYLKCPACIDMCAEQGEHDPATCDRRPAALVIGAARECAWALTLS